MILLKSLKLHNFLSHEETMIEFKDQQKLLVDGVSGCGKSSVLEGIIWALYGIGRSSNASLVRRGSKKAMVILALIDGDKIFDIERSISSTGKHTLEVRENGIAHTITGVRDLQNWIETELVGASFLLFVNSIAYLQGGTEAFVSQSAAKRKELLLEIVKTGDFDEYYEKAKNKLSELETSLILNADKKNSLMSWITGVGPKIDGKNDIVKKLSLTREDLKTKENKKNEITTVLSLFSNKEKEIKEAKDELDRTTSDIFKIVDSLTGVEIAKKDLASINKIEEAVIGIKKELKECENTIICRENDMSTALEVRKRQTIKLSKKPTIKDHQTFIDHYTNQLIQLSEENTCPSGNECPHFKKRLPLILEAQNKITEHTKMWDEEKKELEEWQNEYDKLDLGFDIDLLMTIIKGLKNNREELLTKLHKFELDITKKDLIQKRIDTQPELEKEKSVKEELVTSITKKINDLEKTSNLDEQKRWDFELYNITTDIECLKKEEAVLIGEIAVIEDIERKVPLTQKELDSLIIEDKNISSQIEKVKLLKDAFGSKGLRTIVIDYILPNLEDRINEILEQMSDFRVRLDTQKEKADGEGSKEGLFITIINEMGEEMDYDVYSGGEKMRITVAITEGLASLTKNIGFRLMDEAIHSMNSDMTQDFVEVVGRLQQRYPQLLMVTHLEEVKGIFEEQINIIKRNGVSSLGTSNNI